MAARRSYRHRVKVMEPVPVQDQTTGDMVTYWQALALDSSVTLDAVPADVLTGPGREFREAGAEQSGVSLRVAFRWFSGLQATHMIEYLGLGYEIRSIETDATGRLEYRVACVGLGKVLPPVPTTPSALYPLDAGAAEVLSLGFLALSLTGGDQTGRLTLLGNGADRQAAAYPAGAFGGTAQSIASDVGQKALEWAPLMPASAGGGAASVAWRLDLSLLTVALSNLVRVRFDQYADGAKQATVYIGAGAAVFTDTLAAFPARVGVYLDADTGTATVYFDGVALALTSPTYTPAASIAAIQVYEKAACPAGDAGKITGATLYTSAADLTGAYPAGATDIAGNALTASSALYPLDETEAAIITAGNTGRLTLSNGDQIGARTLPGVGAAEAWVAVPAGFFTATQATFSLQASTGTKVLELALTAPAADNIGSANQTYIAGLAIYDESTNVLLVEASFYAVQDGTFIGQVTTTGGQTDFPGLLACPAVVGLEFNTAAGTLRALFDDTPQALTFNAFTPANACAVLNLSPLADRLAADEGKTVVLSLRTVAATMTGTAYASGATDVAGDLV